MSIITAAQAREISNMHSEATKLIEERFMPIILQHAKEQKYECFIRLGSCRIDTYFEMTEIEKKQCDILNELGYNVALCQYGGAYTSPHHLSHEKYRDYGFELYWGN